MEEKHSSEAGNAHPQNILSQTSRHNDSDYRLPRAETQCSAAPEQHNSKPVVLPAASAPSTVSSSPFTLLPGHQPKKSFAANGAATLSKLPPPTSSTPVQKSERKGMYNIDYLNSLYLEIQAILITTRYSGLSLILYTIQMKI